MEKTGSAQIEDEFRLTSPPDLNGELFLKSVLEDMESPQPKRPL